MAVGFAVLAYSLYAEGPDAEPAGDEAADARADQG